MESSFQFDNNPKGNFDALWNIIDRNYCFFEYKNINWDAVYKNYSSRITPNMNNEALFKLMGQMLAELKDGHVNLTASHRSEEHTSELQSRPHLVCRLLLEKNK